MARQARSTISALGSSFAEAPHGNAEPRSALPFHVRQSRRRRQYVQDHFAHLPPAEGRRAGDDHAIGGASQRGRQFARLGARAHWRSKSRFGARGATRSRWCAKRPIATFRPIGRRRSGRPARRSAASPRKDASTAFRSAIVTQRPAELDATVLSQCSTMFAMRLANEHDKAIIRSAVGISSASTIAFLSSIADREAIAFGEAIATPMRMKFGDNRLEEARAAASARRRGRRSPGWPTSTCARSSADCAANTPAKPSSLAEPDAADLSQSRQMSASGRARGASDSVAAARRGRCAQFFI